MRQQQEQARAWRGVAMPLPAVVETACVLVFYLNGRAEHWKFWALETPPIRDNDMSLYCCHRRLKHSN